MRKISSALSALLAVSFAMGTLGPVAAAPAFAPKAPEASSSVIEAQTRPQRRFERRQERRENRFERRQERRENRFEERNGEAYFNGRRGYRERRSGYREYNGYWFPATAFIAGAIIGGALNNAPVVRSTGSAHVRWCTDRWRSYRAYDNSYQPIGGPRRACVSPY